MSIQLSKTLTDGQKREYLSHGGARCPYCKSKDLEANGSPQIDGPDAWQEMYCLTCGSGWRDYYKLDDIIEM